MSLRIKQIGCALMLSLAISMASADVVVVVSAKNPVTTLTHQQLSDIYLGRISHFPNGRPATPLDQPQNSPPYVTFYRQYLHQTPTQIKMHWARLIFTGRGQPPRSLKDGKAMADYVAKNDNAIGYLGDTFLDKRLRMVPID